MSIKERGLYHWNNTCNNVIFKAKQEMGEGKQMSVGRLQKIYDDEIISWSSMMEPAGSWLSNVNNEELSGKIRAAVAAFKFAPPAASADNRKAYLIFEAVIILASVIACVAGKAVLGVILFLAGSGIVIKKILSAVDKMEKGKFDVCFEQLRSYGSKIGAVLSEFDK